MENQLTITDKSAISKLPVNLQKYALAKEGEIVSKMSQSFGIKSISEVIHNAMINVGMNPTEGQGDVLLNIAENVYKLINDKYKTITINEFKLACLNGSLEDYGKYYGINLKTISDWLKGYLNDENKKKAMAEWNKMLDLVQVRNYTDQQKEQIIVDGCIHFFNEYRQNGLLKQTLAPVDSLCAVFYDKLKEKQLLIFTKERKLEIYKEAESKYTKQLEDARNNRKMKFEQKDMDALINSMANNSNKPFANMCKKISLLRYFDELIEMDQDLKELLNELN